MGWAGSLQTQEQRGGKAEVASGANGLPRLEAMASPLLSCTQASWKEPLNLLEFSLIFQ